MTKVYLIIKDVLNEINNNIPQFFNSKFKALEFVSEKYKQLTLILPI